MISHRYKCIFIHIPKCAGTSIETALGHFDGHKGRGGQDHRTIRMIEPISLRAFGSKGNLKQLWYKFKHQHIIRVQNPRNQYSVTSHQYNTYFKFTIVRNPWARAFSWYKNVMRDELHRENYGIDNSISFKEFLKLFAGTRMLRPQTYWLKNFANEIPMDYIGRFENLLEDFYEICEYLHLDDIKLPHKRKGADSSYLQSYDEDSKKIIEDIYEEEIKLFGYTFEK